MRTAFITALVAVCAALSAHTVPIRAQTAQAGPFEVFFNSNISKGKPGLFFVNVRTGLSSVVVTNGIRHALLGSGVLFQESGTNALKMAYPDGRIEAYAPIQSDSLINWITSRNGQWIAWTRTQTQGSSVLNDLYLARADGSGMRLVLHTSSTKGIVTFPLALTDNGSTIFYARQAPDTGQDQVFPVATDVFSLDTTSGQSTELPGKTACACAVGFSSDGQRFLRLESTDQSAFVIHLWDLAINVDLRIDAPQNSGGAFRQAGYLLVSRDGSVIVYTAMRGTPGGKGANAQQFALIAVDVAARQQRIAAAPLKSNLRPVAFSPDDSTVTLAGVDSDGTYQMQIKSGDLRLITAYTFIGRINQ